MLSERYVYSLLVDTSTVYESLGMAGSRHCEHEETKTYGTMVNNPKRTVQG